MPNHQCGGLRRTLWWIFWISQFVCSVVLAQDTQPPTTPTNFSATASSSTGVVMNWSASTDNVAVTGYQVERCQGSGCNSSFTQFNVASAGWANTGLTPSTTYGYRVRARDAVPNYSAFTSIVYVTTHAAADTQAPTTPANFTAVASSSTGVVLNWNASTDNVAVTGYQLERCQGSGCNSSFTQFEIASAGWANTGLTPSTTYGYRVRAKDAVPNYSAFTGIVYVTTQAASDTQAPTVPTNLTATGSSSTEVTLNWTASTDNVAVTGYEVERCQGSGCNSSFTQFSSATVGLVNTGLAPSTTYGYRVRARDAVPNYSAFTSIVYVTTPAAGGDTQPPTVPTNPTAVASSSTGIIVNWNASTDNVGVASYEVELCQGSGCNSSFTMYGSAGAGRAIGSLTPSTTYGYRVRAKDAVPNYSAYTSMVYVTTQGASDTQAPTVPTNLTGTGTSSSAVTLNWTASTDNVAVTGYEVERCQGSGCTSSFTQLTSATVGLVNTGLMPSTTYGYRVRARDAVPNYSAFTSIVYVTTPGAAPGTVTYGYDQAGRLTYSPHENGTAVTYALDAAGNRVSVVTGPDTTPPGAPATLTASAVSQTQINLSWSAASDNTVIAAYLIERCTGVGCTTFTQVATTGAVTTYSDTGLAGFTDYRYRVRAQDVADNAGAYSPISSAKTLDTTPPAAPTGLATTAVSATQVSLSWSAASDTGGSGLAGYKIFRGGTQIGTSATTTYADTTVSSATTYSYTVAAYDNSGNTSQPSSALSVMTLDITPPTTPTGLNGTAVSPVKNTLSWAASTDNVGVVEYIVYRGGALLGTSTTTTYNDTTASVGTTYSYTVAARDAAGNTSPQSAAANVTTRTTYRITDSAGVVTADSAALYHAGYNCVQGPVGNICTWTLYQSYGSGAAVWSIITGVPSCSNQANVTTTAGYSRPSASTCEINATPSIYGQ